MAPSSVLGLGQRQEQGGIGILEGVGSGDSPSLGELRFAVCHGCLGSQLLRQLSSQLVQIRLFRSLCHFCPLSRTLVVSIALTLASGLGL